MIDATPLLRLYARRRRAVLARQDAAAVQQATLRGLLGRAADTRFGRDHGFSAIRTVAEFQLRVPPRDYDAFWTEYLARDFPRVENLSWPGRMPFFALSSGTSTGRTKYIPVSSAMMRGNRRAALDVLVHHVLNHPGSRILGGRSFMLGGSTALTTLVPGVRAGDLSGIAAAEMPRWARPWNYPPADLALIADWDRKIDTLAAQSPGLDIRGLSGTPSWLLLFLERLASMYPDRPRQLAAYYPALELIVHGGVSMAPYARPFAAWTAGGDISLREVYPASEGFFAIADRAPGEGMRLLLDTRIFYEFVPLEDLAAASPRRHWIANAETGVDYALVVSTCAGLWGHVMGDIVRLVTRDPPRVVVAGRTAYDLSAYGEHLSGGEIERAVLAAAARIGAIVSEYAAGAMAPEAGDGRGEHVFVIEFAAPPPGPADVRAMGPAIDTALLAANDDYRAHRQGGQIVPPRIVAAAPGTFAAWMKSRGKLGGQNKVPRVISDPALLAGLLAAADSAPWGQDRPPADQRP